MFRVLGAIVVLIALLGLIGCSGGKTTSSLGDQTNPRIMVDSNIVPMPGVYDTNSSKVDQDRSISGKSKGKLKGKINGFGSASGGTSGMGNYEDGSYDYVIDRKNPVTVHEFETVCVNGVITNAEFINSNAYMEIGLVTKDMADAILDDWDWPSYMFNQSAFFVIHINSDGNLQFYPSDYNGSPWTPDPSWIVEPNKKGKFNCRFSLKLVPSGSDTPGGQLYLSVNGADYGPPVTYGIDNWHMEWYRWFGYPYPDLLEFYGTDPYYGFDMGAAYLVAQFYTEHPDASVSAHVNARLADK